MVVTLYAIEKRINSTKTPSGGGKAFSSVNLKSPSSVLRPKISFKWDSVGGGLNAPSAYNYAYINDYQRYYWIEEWTYDERQWTASMSVDVLASWKDSIGRAEKYVLRADVTDQTKALIDNKYPAQCYAVEGVATALTGWSNWTSSISSGSVVVSVIGEGNTYSTAGLSYYYMTPTEFNKLVKSCFTQSLNVWQQTTTLGATIGEALQNFGENWLRTLDDPFKYLSGAMWFPFSFPHSSSGENIYLGLLNTGAVGYPLSQMTYTDTALGTVPGQTGVSAYIYTDYLQCEPYLRAEVRMFPFGIIPFRTNETYNRGGSIFLNCIVDGVSGIGRLDVYAGNSANDGYLMNSSSAQVGVPLAVANSSVNYLQALGSAVSAVGNIAAASSGSTVGVLGAAEAIGNTLASLSPRTIVTGKSGGTSGIDPYPRIYTSQASIAETAPAEFGRPVCETRQLNSISGYLQCADPEIKLPTAYPEEIRLVGDYLTGGIFYE